MRKLSTAGEHVVQDVSARHGFDPEAVRSMLQAIVAGHGRMAQFDQPEFGGAGQWMRGGMTMVGDMFNSVLKARVERLCDELSGSLAAGGLFDDAGDARERASVFVADELDHQHWWPADLGRADSAGSQNGARYAYFAGARRLAIAAGGRITVYDTLDHQITGAAQRQSGSGTTTFVSQHGVVDVATLPIVSGLRGPTGGGRPNSSDIVDTIEKLSELHRRGILSDAEFVTKKTELLNRL